MKGHGQSSNHHTVALADAQVRHAEREMLGQYAEEDSRPLGIPAVFRVYTEDILEAFGPFLRRAGFAGATLIAATGIYNDQTERGMVIEIVDTLDARQRILNMALDIAVTNRQHEVLVTWQSNKGFETVRVFGK